MISSDVEIRERLVLLRQEFGNLDAQIDERMMNDTVTDFKLGHMLKRHYELKILIERLEDDLIPDMPA